MFDPSFDELQGKLRLIMEEATALTAGVRAWILLSKEGLPIASAVTQGLEEALRTTEHFHPNLLMVRNVVHPMARRVRILPGDFDNIAGHIWSVSLHQYLEHLLRLATVLD